MKLFHPRRQQGVTLVEVLVALVVLSIGLLGLAGLQLLSLKTNQGSANRTQASAAAASILDVIRGNRAAAANYARDYDTAVPAFSTTSALWEQDYAQVLGHISRALPDGQVEVTVTPQGQPARQRFNIVVNVRWSLGTRGVVDTDNFAIDDGFDIVTLTAEV